MLYVIKRPTDKQKIGWKNGFYQFNWVWLTIVVIEVIALNGAMLEYFWSAAASFTDTKRIKFQLKHISNYKICILITFHTNFSMYNKLFFCQSEKNAKLIRLKNFSIVGVKSNKFPKEYRNEQHHYHSHNFIHDFISLKLICMVNYSWIYDIYKTKFNRAENFSVNARKQSQVLTFVKEVLKEFHIMIGMKLLGKFFL